MIRRVFTPKGLEKSAGGRVLAHPRWRRQFHRPTPKGNAVNDFFGRKMRNLRALCCQRRNFGARKTRQTSQITPNKSFTALPFGVGRVWGVASRGARVRDPGLSSPTPSEIGRAHV